MLKFRFDRRISDIKGFEHGLDFANRERDFRHIRRSWCTGSLPDEGGGVSWAKTGAK